MSELQVNDSIFALPLRKDGQISNRIFSMVPSHLSPRHCLPPCHKNKQRKHTCHTASQVHSRTTYVIKYAVIATHMLFAFIADRQCSRLCAPASPNVYSRGFAAQASQFYRFGASSATRNLRNELQQVLFYLFSVSLAERPDPLLQPK